MGSAPRVAKCPTAFAFPNEVMRFRGRAEEATAPVLVLRDELRVLRGPREPPPFTETRVRVEAIQ